MKFTIASSVTENINKYKGQPSIVRVSITDSYGYQYLATIEMPTGWDMLDLGIAVKDAAFQCEGCPETVHILSIEYDFKLMN